MPNPIPFDRDITFDNDRDALEAKARFLTEHLIRPGQLVGVMYPDNPKKASPVSICFDPGIPFCRNLVRCHLAGEAASVEIRPVTGNEQGLKTRFLEVNDLSLGLYYGGSCDIGGNKVLSCALDADKSWVTAEALEMISDKAIRDQWKADRKKDPAWVKAEAEMLDTMMQEARRLYPEMVFFMKPNRRWHGHCNLDRPMDAKSVREWATSRLTPILGQVEVFPKTAHYGPPKKYSAGNHVRLPWGNSGYDLVGEIRPMPQMDASYIPLGPQNTGLGTSTGAGLPGPELPDDSLENELASPEWQGVSMEDRVSRYGSYLLSDNFPQCESGNKGHVKLLMAASARFGFGVPRDRAMPVLEEYNRTKCHPSWSPKELEHKLRDAKPGPRSLGWLLCEDRDKPTFGLQPPIKAYTINDLLSLADEDVPWIWDGYLARNAVTMLHGSPKVGKSTLVFALVSAIVDGGRPFLGRPTEHCGVVYLTEENASTVLEKAEAFGIVSGQQVRFISTRLSIGANLAGAEQAVLKTVEEVSAGLVVVDTVSAWAAWGADDENKSSKGEEFAALAKTLASKGNIAVLLLHHSRKNQGDDAISAARGTSGLTGACDIVAMLQRAPQAGAGQSRRIVASGRYSATPPFMDVELSEEGTGYVLAMPADLESRHASLLSRLPIHSPGITADELVDKASIKKGRLRLALSDLLGAELIARTGTGKRGDPYRFYRAAESTGFADWDDQLSVSNCPALSIPSMSARCLSDAME